MLQHAARVSSLFASRIVQSSSRLALELCQPPLGLRLIPSSPQSCTFLSLTSRARPQVYLRPTRLRFTSALAVCQLLNLFVLTHQLTRLLVSTSPPRVKRTQNYGR